MRSIPVAMTWEMFSRGRWSLIGAALAAMALPTIVLGALHRVGAFESGDQSQITIHMVMVQISMFVFAAGVFAAQGAPARLFALPVTTSSLVMWRMLPAMAMVSLETLASTVALNAMFNVGWPLWGPALFAGVAVAAVQAMLWFFDRSAWLPWAVGIVAAVLGVWNKSRYGEALSQQPTQMWAEATPFEVLTLLSFAVLSWYIAHAGITRNRRGESPPSLGIITWLERVIDPAPKVDRRFLSPAEAQSWMEWQRKGGAMPAGVFFCMILGLGFWLIVDRNPEELFHGFVAGGGLLSVLAMVIGMLIGNIGPNDANFEMGHFRATRPMTNTEMARTILKTAGKSVFIAWLIWAVSVLALYLILLATNSVPQQALPDELTWWYFPATLIGPWIVVTMLTSVGLTGRSHLFVQLMFALLTPFFGLLFLSSLLSRQSNSELAHGLGISCGVVFILGMAWGFLAAHRRSLIGSPMVCAALAAWLVLSALVGLAGVLRPGGPISVFVFVIGLAALAVAPFATAPLAVAWNRNR